MWPGKEQERVDACDVIVVGGGLVGAAVAARLAREGLDTAILEARTVAGGATGRGAGMVLTGLENHYSRAVSAYGREKAREVWALTVEGRKRLVETAERLKVPIQKTGSLVLAVEETEAEMLEESADLLSDDGFDVQFAPGDPLERGFLAALRYPEDVGVDAAALTRALLNSGDIIVHEGTEVYDLEPGSEGVRVWAQRRTAFCGAVVLAIDGYAPLFDSYFKDRVVPTRGLVLLGEPLDRVILDQPCSADYGYAYCRQLPNRRLLLGGWRRSHFLSQGENQERELDDVVQEGLTRFASRHFPELDVSAADHRSGVMGFTADGLPLVGALPDRPDVYFAVGFGGRGLSWAFVAAERLANLMLHGTDPGPLAATRSS